MKQVAILSGKGGTGKTTIAAALAHLASTQARVVLADADVDAANLELVLAPRRIEAHDFTGSKMATIDAETCTGRGLCHDVCRFEAISWISRGAGGGGGGKRTSRIDPIACEGCASCFYRCPTGAVRMVEQVVGQWYHSDTRFGPLVHAHLYAGQENSGKLVTRVKMHAGAIAHGGHYDYLIVDGPPGIGCPVIAACSGSDLAILIAEPSIASLHDLERILATTAYFGVPSVVIVNKHDLSSARTREIEGFCASLAVKVVGRLPFDTVVTEAMVSSKAVTEYTTGAVTRAMVDAWAEVKAILVAGKPVPAS